MIKLKKIKIVMIKVKKKTFLFHYSLLTVKHKGILIYVNN